MAEIRQKTASHEEAVRVVERNDRNESGVAAGSSRNATGDPGAVIHDLERRVSSLQNDVTQLVSMAAQVRAQSGEGALRLPTPAFFAGLNRWGPSLPGFVPPVHHAGPVAPAFGFGVPAFHLSGEALTTRDFGAQPTVARQPGVNIVDAGEDYVLQVELPGTRKGDLEILGSDRSVTITAHGRPDPETEGTVILGEVAPATYRRTIHLPTPCSTTRSRASLRDGILTLNIPKKDPSEGMRRIDVAYG